MTSAMSKFLDEFGTLSKLTLFWWIIRFMEMPADLGFKLVTLAVMACCTFLRPYTPVLGELLRLDAVV